MNDQNQQSNDMNPDGNDKKSRMEELRRLAGRLPAWALKLIYDAAKALPEAARSEFTRRCLELTKEFALIHPRTVFYGAGGVVVGHLLDGVLSIHLAGQTWIITGGHAATLGGIVGAIYGFKLDRDKAEDTRRVESAIRRARRLEEGGEPAA